MHIPSLYIHIPFCARKCLYCDFYSVPYDPSLAAVYIALVVRQVTESEGGFTTAYIGGGTPSALDAALLTDLLGAVRRRCAGDAEVTVEANPESIDREKLAALRDEGATRLSIGVQSFDDRKLRQLGRIHDADRARAAVDAASAAGFRNIGIDLIYGVAGETLGAWEAEMASAVRLPITHLSCYSLTYERGTPLDALARQGKVSPSGDDLLGAMYRRTIEYLPAQGFGHYEVSNFAKEGYRCRHNLAYWDNAPYRGIGASAVSYIDGVRMKHVADVAEYIRRALRGETTIASSEKLEPARRARETAAVKIRTAAGIQFDWFRRVTGFDLAELERESLPRLIDDGLIVSIGEGGTASGIRLTQKGFLFCDTVSSAFV